MANEDLHQLNDMALVNERYKNQRRVYRANTTLKNDPGNVAAQQQLHDATEQQSAVETHISQRIARNRGSNPSTTL